MINGQRIHGLDALRAIAMLLGVLLHAASGYRVEQVDYWIHDEQYNSIVFDFFYFFIHSFRMPLFFLIAGFFSRFLYFRSGEKAFIKNRWRRIGIPFLIGLITIVPLSMLPFNFYIFYYKQHLSWDVSIQKSIRQLFGRNGTAHLWFLYDLLMFYTGVILVMRLKNIAFFNKIFNKISESWDRLNLRRYYWIFLFSIPIWLILLNDPLLFVRSDTELIPSHFSFIFFYGYVFFVGWSIQKRMDILNILIEKFSGLLLFGILLCCGLFYIKEGVDWKSNIWMYYTCKFGAALQVVLLSGGMIGFFLRFFNSESKLWRYVSDASYWIYLVHLGMVVTMEMLFFDTPVPGILRFLLSLFIPVAISFITYHLFVRYTIIGTTLNGVRKR